MWHRRKLQAEVEHVPLREDSRANPTTNKIIMASVQAQGFLCARLSQRWLQLPALARWVLLEPPAAQVLPWIQEKAAEESEFSLSQAFCGALCSRLLGHRLGL